MELPPTCFQVALDAIPAAAFTVDAGQRVVMMNKKAEALFDLPRSTIFSCPLPNLVDGLAWLAPALETGSALSGRESALFVGKQSVSVLVDVAPLPAADLAGALVVFRKSQDAENLHHIEHLESLAGIGEIAASAIHEIRNPLTSISGFIQLIQARAIRQTDQASLDYCTLIAEEISHINSILSDFLTLAKSRGSKISIVDIGQLIHDVGSLMYGEAVLSKIQIVPHLPNDPMLICGNGDKIKEVLINLYRNAFYAMPNGGILTITIIPDSASVRVVVADTGWGMSKAVMTEIFKPFYTTKENGTGLGLAICRRIMQEHGGEITVTSEIGQGANFILTFPRLQESRS